MRLTTFIALTSANETALTVVSDHLTQLITDRGESIILLQGVRNAFEAQAVLANRGEIWRIGEDASAPELDLLVDCTIDDTSHDTLIAGTEEALDAFLGKVKVTA